MSLSYTAQSITEKAEPQTGSHKHAYVTFMIMNDSFLPGALMFAYGLKNQQVKSDIVCLVSGKISKSAIGALYNLFDKVISVPEVFVEHSLRHERQDRPYLFSRFNALRLGRDGDLRQNYQKIIVCDADLVPISNYESLFTLNTPAGIINEHKINCMSCDENGHYIVGNKIQQTGKWRWHEIYETVCPHGKIIPANITNRVRRNTENMGVNASLWVLKPSMDEYCEIMQDVKSLETIQLINKFKWPEMQYATLRWSGRWTNIDLKYSSFNGYPCIELLNGIHYAGAKPWKYKSLKQLEYFLHFPDYLYWYVKYLQMMAEHNKLFSCDKLSRIYNDVLEAFSMLL